MVKWENSQEEPQTHAEQSQLHPEEMKILYNPKIFLSPCKGDSVSKIWL